MSPDSVVYDSSNQTEGLVADGRKVWAYRGLVRLLVSRNITVRYKRSVLGVWWTVLNPLLTACVMWLVFSRIFRFATPGVPFIVYLLAGVLLITYFSQGVVQCANSIVHSSAVLTKVYVPPVVFALAAGIAAAVNCFFGIVALLLIQLATGAGIPWTVVLLPVPILAMLALVTGLGLVVAAAAVFFYDIFDMTNVGLQLAGYLTPTFYPITIVPPSFRLLIELNPLYWYLRVFRSLAYEGVPAPWYFFVGMFAFSLLAVAVGSRVFSRSWKNLVVIL